MAHLPHLSDGEFRIMDTIWSSEKELTQALVMKTVNRTLDKPLNVSTYATYLRRIMKKGYLEKVYLKEDVTHPIYRPVISREEYFERNAKEFEEKWSNRIFLKMVMSRSHSYSSEQIEQLKFFFDDSDKNEK